MEGWRREGQDEIRSVNVLHYTINATDLVSSAVTYTIICLRMYNLHCILF